MEKGYETVCHRPEKASSCGYGPGRKKKIYFAKDGEKYGCSGDRLFVESADIWKRQKQICGLHTEELYERYCQEHIL